MTLDSSCPSTLAPIVNIDDALVLLKGREHELSLAGWGYTNDELIAQTQVSYAARAWSEFEKRHPEQAQEFFRSIEVECALIVSNLPRT
jgi:hypothetical protein